MSPRRVFKGHTDRPDRVEVVVSTGDIQEDELTLFVREVERKASDSSFGLLNRLSRIPPARRLSVNLKVLLDIMSSKEVTDTLRDGLTAQEKQVLIELQIVDVTPRVREIAHGLLCIDERAQFIADNKVIFKDLVTRKGGYLKS